MKQRLQYIDILRAVAIFLVTLGHTLEYGGYRGGLLYGVIYSFHMPLFFSISGFVAGYALRGADGFLRLNGFASVVWKKFRFIIIPYIVWNLLVHPFAFSYANGGVEWYMALCRSVLIDNTSSWFLPCLFGHSVLFGFHRLVFCRLERRGASTISVDVVGMVLVFVGVVVLYKITYNPFLRSIVSYFIPYVFGVLMGRHVVFDKLVTENKWCFVLSCIVFALASGVFVGGVVRSVELTARLVAGIAAIPFFFSLVKAFSLPKQMTKLLVCVGQNTLIIYCLQNWVRIPCIAAWGLSPMLQFMVFGVVSAVAISVMVVFAKILEWNVVLRQMLLGRR